jgi:hypothetical protein
MVWIELLCCKYIQQISIQRDCYGTLAICYREPGLGLMLVLNKNSFYFNCQVKHLIG